MSGLVVRLLGGLDVIHDGGPVTGFDSATSRALLARLAAVPGDPLARDALAELLWPERPPGGGLANLRHALSNVRQAIGDQHRARPVVVAGPDAVAVDPCADVVVDVAELRRLATTPASTVGSVAAWEDAVGLRRGPFLDGFERSFSPEWDLWVETTRVDVDELVTSALHRLADLRQRTGERERLRAHLAEWIAIDRWDERAHRILMRDLVDEGRPAAAVAHGDELAARLRDELGVEPAAETSELVEQIRRGGRTAALRTPDRDAATLRWPVPCVGRDREREWLGRRLDEALLGNGSIAFVIGEAGVGKSVLTETFVADARSRMERLVTARGVCNAFAGGGDPLFPFRQILGTLFDDDAGTDRLVDATEIVLDDGPDLLGSLVDVDALVARLDELTPRHPLLRRLRASTTAIERRAADPTRRQFPLLDQCSRVLVGYAARHPLLLVLDDLQWADDGTLDLLGHLSERISGTPLLVVGALRPPDVAGDRISDRIGALVSEIDARGGGDRTLELSGSREFVDAWLDLEPNLLDEVFRDRLHRLTGGHPLFTVETVNAMREDDRLRRDAGGRWVEGEQDVLRGLPPRVDATIAARLARLPGQLRLDLDAAAVQGDLFATEVVAAVRGLPVEDVAHRLSTAGHTPHSLIGPATRPSLGATSAHGWRFRHALFRQHLYDHLDDADRASLHRATAHALVDLAGEQLDDVAAELADHFDRAGSDEAVEAHQRAGQRAMRLGATRVAATHFDRALELLAGRPPSAERDRSELALLTALGACRQALDGYTAPPTVEVYERLRDLAARTPVGPETIQALAVIMSVDALRARYDTAIATGERLLDSARELGLTPIVALCHSQLAWSLLLTGRLVEADEHLRRADELHDPAWDEPLTWAFGQSVRATSLAWHSIVAWHLGRFDDARRLGDASIEEARRLGHPFTLGFTLAVGGCLRWGLFGEPGPNESAADELAALAEREDLEFYRGAARLHRGTAWWQSGRLDDGLAENAAGFAAWAELGTDAFATWALTLRAEALIRGGRLDDAAQTITETEQRLEDGQERLAELRLPLVRGMLLRAMGELAGAERELRAAVELAAAHRASGVQLQAAVELASLLAETERSDEAVDLLHDARSRVTDSGAAPDVVAASTLLGQLCPPA